MTDSIRLLPNVPAVILAPMEGLTDAPMRAVQSELGAFTFAVSEFLRISESVPSKKVYSRHVPELRNGARTPSGLPVQIQLLGGHAGRMAEAATLACSAGAPAVDINFGCPAPTVNRHDGGATLLKYPARIREIVAAIRAAVPPEIPVSAKLRLGWDSVDAIYENAEMAVEGGAAWLTIHGRTRAQGYQPPALWQPIGKVRERVGIPVVANGDIWSVAEFRRCQEETGCVHFMLGRGAIANPLLSHQISCELGLRTEPCTGNSAFDWPAALRRLFDYMAVFQEGSGQSISPGKMEQQKVRRVKQWLKIASTFGDFSSFERIKYSESVEEIFALLAHDVRLTESR